MKKYLIFISSLFICLLLLIAYAPKNNRAISRPNLILPRTETSRLGMATATTTVATTTTTTTTTTTIATATTTIIKATTSPATSIIIYQNKQYGFSLDLTPDWQGYSVKTNSIKYGFKIVLRHPKWTAKNPYEDIPILVYPLKQWQKWEATNFDGYPTAAPIGPSERGRNNLYVLATAPRYNFDFNTGFEEVENIIKTLTTSTLPGANFPRAN